MSKKPSPKVSVIMAAFNAMPYLKIAVKSILDQTYTDFEIIIVDDASDDSSWKYLKSLKNPRIKLIKNKKNLGLAKSLNIALRRAQGHFIARMDADDFSSPERLREQVNFLQKNKTIALCGTYAFLINESGKKIGMIYYPETPQEIRKKIVLFNPIIHPSIMARKSFFEKLNGYREEYDGAEDYDLLIRGADKFEYANLTKELIALRLLPSRRSARSMGKMDKLDLKIKMNYLKENGFSANALFAIVKKLHLQKSRFLLSNTS